MQIVFESGAVMDWARRVMNRSDDRTSPELKASAILIVGNVARNGITISMLSCRVNHRDHAVFVFLRF